MTDAMSRYGSDKPDTRFGMELIDIAEVAETKRLESIYNCC